jgi:DamX protein
MIAEALGAQGYEHSGPFSDDKIRHIFQQGQGLFAPTKQLIQQEWDNYVDQLDDDNGRQRSHRPKTSMLKYATLALLFVTGLTFLALQLSHRSDELVSLEQADQNSEQLALPEQSVPLSQQSGGTIARPKAEKSNDSLVDKVNIDLAQTKTQAPAQKQPAPKQKPEPTQPEQVAELVESKPQTKPAMAPRDSRNEQRIHREAWLATQSGGNYTLQLLASRKEQAILDFIEQRNLSNNAAYFQSEKKGETWYSVVYGVYDNRTAAEQAARSLPNTLSDVKPWIRSMKSVQADIGTTAFAGQ